MTSITPYCFKCKNYEDRLMCKAFPEGIPDEILLHVFDHTKKHPGQDNDILFEPIEE